MSVIVTANYEGETFEVEIFRDGSLDFPGNSLEQDRTVAALGGEPSVIVKFENDWIEKPHKVICRNIDPQENNTVHMMADFSEHVLYIFEDKYPDDKRPRQSINAVMKFVLGEIDTLTLKKVREDGTTAMNAVAAATAIAAASADAAAWEGSAIAGANVWAATVAATAAAWSATYAAACAVAWGEGRKTWREISVSVVDWAVEAAAYNISPNPNSTEWLKASNAEVAWQVRRFVDCMEAIGRGLQWPPLEATE